MANQANQLTPATVREYRHNKRENALLRSPLSAYDIFNSCAGSSEFYLTIKILHV